jgi:hypothetical protein
VRGEVAKRRRKLPGLVDRIGKLLTHPVFFVSFGSKFKESGRSLPGKTLQRDTPTVWSTRDPGDFLKVCERL